MKIVAGTPSSEAARATPWAWLPALAATTPAARSAGASRAMRWYAPRILNEPVRWRYSALRRIGRPASTERCSEPSTGVRRTTGARRRRAASMSSRVTSGQVEAAGSARSRILPPGPRSRGSDRDALADQPADEVAGHPDDDGDGDHAQPAPDGVAPGEQADRGADDEQRHGRQEDGRHQRRRPRPEQERDDGDEGADGERRERRHRRHPRRPQLAGRQAQL